MGGRVELGELSEGDKFRLSETNLADIMEKEEDRESGRVGCRNTENGRYLIFERDTKVFRDHRYQLNRKRSIRVEGSES